MRRFNGITSQLIGASISNFVRLSSGFVICSGYIDAINTNNTNNTGAGNAANNDILWGDDAGYLQMALLSRGPLAKDRISCRTLGRFPVLPFRPACLW